MDNQNLSRRPLIIQVDSWTESGEPQRNRIVIPNPIASCFRVTNGKFMALVTIDELGIEVKAYDKDGTEEKLVTRNLKL